MAWRAAPVEVDIGERSLSEIASCSSRSIRLERRAAVADANAHANSAVHIASAPLYGSRERAINSRDARLICKGKLIAERQCEAQKGFGAARERSRPSDEEINVVPDKPGPARQKEKATCIEITMCKMAAARSCRCYSGGVDVCRGIYPANSLSVCGVIERCHSTEIVQPWD
jgi:hypothetical protein